MKCKRGLVVALAMAAFFGMANLALAADVIKIAVPSPFTGPAAGYGDNVKAGVAMKVDEINAKGGVNGQKIEAVFFDEQCDPKEAATVGTKIAGDKALVGIVGHLCSGAHLAALPNYLRAGVAAMSPTATNVTISDKNKDAKGQVWSFRNVYRDDFQGAFLADYMAKTLGLKKVAVFYENSDYGIGLKDAFLKQAKAVGLTVVGEEAYMKGANDFTPQLTKIKGQAPDALFISGYYNEGALVADQAKKLGLAVPKFGADGLDNADYIKLAGPAADNTYLTAPFLAEKAGPEAKAFIDAFKAKYNRDVDWMSANAYDAAGMIIEAISKVGADRAKVREYLASMNSKEKGYKGITGLTFFNDKGDCEKPAFVKMVKDGKFVPAEKQMAN
ncbi:Leucine-, isoleucine-, valine-, threonine-, and alanine-binding protein [Fundidesulfovibrio magnetotacticus]|uniref:Leucine-, isoleucine-, valine-, threonine-, and alanine-binding protein n=1 Tax=Fundidesulfovibrio magnetotacticus TaxID=2730080 RepID=A0A6V8LW35_9BACT|nr:ABC transporter substrate-binding protein [Fundidesulfovibrio magnetotacticus]GFK94269.1 Leucine-, isoleucine-, valine-, threonine-, and alanine-binding protein [Fundidesulfovibrio magnetotacticus]